jgi:O-antigen/teichoic acid export membrane protein
MRYGWPIVVSGLAALATSGLDRWFLADATGTAAMAQYAIAAKFALVVALLLQPYGMWWFPRRFRVLREEGGQAHAARGAAIGAALGAVVAVGIAFTAPLALELLFPPAYHPASALVPWLAGAMALKNAAELLNLGCYTGITTHTQPFVNLTGAAIAVVGFLFLIPPWGAEGAAGALVLAQAVRLVLFIWLSQRVLPLPYPSAQLGLLGVLTLLGLIASTAAQGAAAAWLIAATGWTLMGLAAWRLRLLPLPRSSARAS